MDVSKKPEDPPEDENFIVTATAVATPCPPKARPYLEVVAPATLPEVRVIVYGAVCFRCSCHISNLL
jgi:hypothetical protein